MKQRLKSIATSPKTKQALASMKPTRSIWGFLGVIVFFIVPEIIAFIWGLEITAYASQALPHSSGAQALYYEALIMLFESGGSWINLAIGFALLVWLFF
jgi:hypothetical protein